MRVLVACEFSGVVREAFRARGHFARSCDLLDTDRPGPHHVGDVLEHLHWNRRRPERAAQTEAALDFVRALLAAAVPRIALENPIGCISTRIRRPDDITHPWEFGEDASKATCWWLVGLPPLVRTNVLPGGRKARRANQTPSGQNRLGPSPDRWKLRSATYQGVADAMAEQWGSL